MLSVGGWMEIEIQCDFQYTFYYCFAHSPEHFAKFISTVEEFERQPPYITVLQDLSITFKKIQVQIVTKLESIWFRRRICNLIYCQCPKYSTNSEGGDGKKWPAPGTHQVITRAFIQKLKRRDCSARRQDSFCSFLIRTEILKLAQDTVRTLLALYVWMSF